MKNCGNCNSNNSTKKCSLGRDEIYLCEVCFEKARQPQQNPYAVIPVEIK